jgi:hypothetical protein
VLGPQQRIHDQRHEEGDEMLVGGVKVHLPAEAGRSSTA